MGRLLLVLVLVAGCFAGTQVSDEDRIRKSLATAPEMRNPAFTGVPDGTSAGNWDSDFEMISYAPERACFLVRWNVPEDIAPTLTFKLGGWRHANETRDSAPQVTSDTVEVLDAKTLATVKHYDAWVGNKSISFVERRDKEQAVYQTAMRVCFPDAEKVLELAQYMLITVDADARHRTGAGWRLVTPKSPTSKSATRP
jgi:hypothetical protein